MKNTSDNVRFYSSIQKKNIEFFWYPYIPFGKVTLIQGDPGCGKSSLIIKLASIASSAGTMPDGMVIQNAFNVIYQCIEDGAADTIKPRLENNGADLTHISFITDNDEPLSVIDKEKIISSINDTRSKLVIFDPIQSFVGNSGYGTSVAGSREFMNTLISIAEETGAAVVIIGHLNKNESSKDLYRGLGSIDIAASVRSVIQVDRLEDNSNVRCIKHIKSSLAPEGDVFGFEIQKTGYVEFIGSIDLGQEQESIIDQSRKSYDTKSSLAESLLLDSLYHVDMKYSDILQLIKKNDISVRTLNNAKKSLGVSSIKKKDGWYWHLTIDNEASS